MGRKDKPVVLNEGQGNTIGAFLRQQRQQQYISLTQMAALTGYSKTYLSAIENGNIRASRNVVKEYTRHLSLAPDRLPSAFQDPALTTPSDEIQERPWNVPYWRNPLFVGRSETLERLHNRLFSSSRKLSHILTVTGLGGIGKTQLVTEYAYQYRVYYQGIFWIRGDSSEVLFADFATLPLTTGLITEQAEPINVYNPSHTGDATKKWLRQHPPCLLIVDNLDDTQELSALARTTSQLGDTRVIITTRLQIPSQVAQVFELGNLDLDDSTLFLLRRINALPPDGQLADADPTQRILVNEIAHIIDGIPLALDQAGSYIEETDCDLGRYLRLFKQQSSRLLNERGGFALDHPEPIATTWMLAFNKIQQHNATALDLLYLCAFVHPDAIYRELFQQGAPALNPILHETLSDPVTLDQAIGELRKYSILRKTGQHDTFSLHRLVQSVIRDSLDMREQRIWAERAVRIINAIFPRITATDWIQTRTICRKYYVHAQVGLDIATHYQMGFPEVAQLLSKVGKYLDDTSEFNEAEKCYLRAIELGEFLIGVTPDQLTQDYTNLALLYENMEKYRQAEEYYKKAMSSRQSEIAAGNFTPAIQETLRNYTTFLMKFEQRKNEAARLRAHTTGQLAPCVRHLTINDDHPDIIYEHAWEIHNEPQGQKTGDYGGNTHYTSVVGATFQYTFTGFGIAILADTTSDQGIIDIYLDDRYVLRKDICHDAEHQPQTIVYHQERLDYGTHTLHGELISGTFALDAFVIFTYDEPLDDQ